MSWSELADLPLVATRDVFGEPVSYTPAGGSPLEISAAFSEDALLVSTEPGGVMVRSGRPGVDVRLADLPGVTPQRGDQIVARGTQYSVEDIVPDGQGGALLLLYLATP